MAARSRHPRGRRIASETVVRAPGAGALPTEARRSSRGVTFLAALPALLSLALLAFFTWGTRGAPRALAGPPSVASAAAFAKAASAAPSAARSTAGAEAGGDVPPPPGPDEKVLLFDPRDGGWREGPAREAPKGGELVHAGRLLRVSRALGAAQWVREVDVAKLGDADATYDPAAPRREPEADDVVRVLGEAGRHTALGRVEPGERVAFQGRVYETRAGPGGGLEVRDSGLRVNRVTRTYRRHGPTLVDLTVRYGDGREGVLTGTPEHPFYVPARGGYVPMGELAPGVALQTTDGAEATVAARSERPADVEVHNLEVEHAHNYFVSPPGSGGPGVLVHNATYGSGGGPKPNAKPGSAGGPRAKMPFTRRGREIVREENRAAHGGKLTCEHCGRNDLVEPGQTRGGQPRLQNEAQVDHIIPESKGGDGAPSNGQVLCLTCNGLKKDKM